MWAAACRAYPFIGDFAEQVLRERFLLLVPTLTPKEFDSFVRTQSAWHPELEALSDSMYRGAQQTVFKMMRDADLLSKDGEIQPAVLSPRVEAALAGRIPSDLRFFPVRQPANAEVIR